MKYKRCLIFYRRGVSSGKNISSGKNSGNGLELLKDHNVEMYNKEELISIDELTERVKDKDALLSLLSTKVPKEVIDARASFKDCCKLWCWLRQY